MKRTLIFMFFMAGLLPAFSQTFFDTATKKKWKGEGILLGAEATFEMKWGKVLGGQFYQLTFQNERITETGKITFNAMGFYKPKEDGLFEGTWLDSRGLSFPLKGTVANNQLVVDWGTPDTEVGKSIYTINTDGTISVEDYIQQEGKSTNFGKATYK